MAVAPTEKSGPGADYEFNRCHEWRQKKWEEQTKIFLANWENQMQQNTDS